ncbi:site-specific DNA-methyltransferase [Aquirufa lenticrescens]
MAKVNKLPAQKEIDSYDHKGVERVNIPQVGLVKPETDPDTGKRKSYQFDPHLDPQLQWAGKAERTSFEVPTASLHIHERIDPRRIVDTVRKQEDTPQLSLFEAEKKPLREAIEFYKHKENWSNRLIAGDSLVIMNSLLEKEAMAGKVQMVYFDPPYGIKYGSNFQPFVNKRDVKDGNDNDLSSEPEMLKAFRDTWELGIHSYLTYLRDRLLLAKDLLSETGSIFVQISDENLHHVKEIMDEIFGSDNFMSTITFKTKIPLGTKFLAGVSDYIVWYSRDKKRVKYNKLFKTRNPNDFSAYNWVEENDGTRRPLTSKEMLDKNSVKGKVFWPISLWSTGRTESCVYDYEFEGIIYKATDKSWKTTKSGMDVLKSRNRLLQVGSQIRYVLYLDDYPVFELDNLWYDTVNSYMKKVYVVQTNTEVVKRCMLMATDPSDLVIDISCGSGTTAFVSETLGRRWITCDTSRIALTLAKQRLLTASFDFYKLAHVKEGISSGFTYKTVPHITLGSIANNEPTPVETLFDQPLIDSNIIRVTGPFTMEAVPAPTVLSLGESINNEEILADSSISRIGGTRRQDEWRSELLRTGVRGKGGAKIEFSRVEPIQGTTYLQAEAEVKDSCKKVLVCFGPENAPLEQRLVELALEEAGNIKPKPDMVLFCAFQFDEEASKDIDETNWPGVNLLKAQMNMDLQTDDLKKGNRSSESFWLIGQPDVEPIKLKDGTIQVSVNGFDYYDPKSGQVVSGGKDKIAMWLLDHDYDGRSLFPSQVFLPLSGAKEGWSTLAKNLKAEIDEDKIEAYSGTVSLPFMPGKQVAVKIIDDRGIESLKIIKL